jgi:AraC-like DNA-binding protein
MFTPLEPCDPAIGLRAFDAPKERLTEVPAVQNATTNGAFGLLSPEYDMVCFRLQSIDIVLRISRFPIHGRGIIAGEFRIAGPKGAQIVPAERIVARLGRSLLNGDDSDNGEEISHDHFANPVSLAIATRLLCSPIPDPLPRPQRSPLVKWRLKRALNYLEAHLADPVTLAKLASSAGLKPMYFAAQFKAATGLRPHEYLLRKRVERAQLLLTKSDLPLVDIALGVGFQSQAHFTTVFKRVVGETPYRWRLDHHPHI